MTVVEWGERIRSALPVDLLDIRLEYGERTNDRRIELTPVGRTWMQRLPELQSLAVSIPDTEVPAPTAPGSADREGEPTC